MEPVPRPRSERSLRDLPALSSAISRRAAAQRRRAELTLGCVAAPHGQAWPGTTRSARSPSCRHSMPSSTRSCASATVISGSCSLLHDSPPSPHFERDRGGDTDAAPIPVRWRSHRGVVTNDACADDCEVRQLAESQQRDASERRSSATRPGPRVCCTKAGRHGRRAGGLAPSWRAGQRMKPERRPPSPNHPGCVTRRTAGRGAGARRTNGAAPCVDASPPRRGARSPR